MSIQWNDNADEILAQMMRRTKLALESVVNDFSGRPVEEVKIVLAERWAASNEGASITEPDLTNVATLISAGKRVWIEPDGRILADD